MASVDTSLLFSMNIGYWLLQTVAMLLTCFLIPGLKVTGPFWAFITVVCVALINSKVWDAALFFNIPNQFTTQALVVFLANGIIFWVVVKLLPGIEVQGFIPALVAPVVFAVCSLVIGQFAPQIDWVKVLDFCINQLGQLRSTVHDNMVPNLKTGVPSPHVSPAHLFNAK